MGRLLGKGLTFSDAVEHMEGETIEGVDAILAIMPAIEQLTAQHKLDVDALPLIRTLYRIITNAAPIDIAFNSFFSKLHMSPPEDPSAVSHT